MRVMKTRRATRLVDRCKLGIGGLAFILLLVGCRSQVGLPTGPVPPPDRSVVASPLPVIAFTIQVGAFSTTERASRYADQLAGYGLDTYYFIDTDGLCKVRFDRFETKYGARQRALELQSRGVIDGFYIVRPGPAGRNTDARENLQDGLVQTARRFIGTPYRWGGESARSGFDCSGLTMTVYRLNGLELPRNSRSQFRAGRPVTRGALQRGDLVFSPPEALGAYPMSAFTAARGTLSMPPAREKPSARRPCPTGTSTRAMSVRGGICDGRPSGSIPCLIPPAVDRPVGAGDR